MVKHLLTPANAQIFDTALDQIATAADGKPFPGGFLTSARKADPSGAAAHRAGRSAAGKLGGKLGGKQAQKDAAVEAVKAGAPAGSGGGSKKSAMVWQFSGGSKSSSSTWAEREAIAKDAVKKGSALGGKNVKAAKAIEALALSIATHSYECMDPQCRRPVKLVANYSKGRMYTNFSHKCMAKKGKQVNGLAQHLCSSCHQTARTCKATECRYPKCSTSKPGCAHLHDGSGIPRK